MKKIRKLKKKRPTVEEERSEDEIYEQGANFLDKKKQNKIKFAILNH